MQVHSPTVSSQRPFLLLNHDWFLWVIFFISFSERTEAYKYLCWPSVVLQGDSWNRNAGIINWPADVGRVVVISSDLLAIIYSIENLFVRQEVTFVLFCVLSSRGPFPFVGDRDRTGILASHQSQLAVKLQDPSTANTFKLAFCPVVCWEKSSYPSKMQALFFTNIETSEKTSEDSNLQEIIRHYVSDILPYVL